jgi:glycosyltransferase involved in cell wall biosynthesis
MSLTIVSVAYPLAPVGPDSVGGSEQILATMDHALVAAGHRSIVVANSDSVVQGELMSFPAPSHGAPITAESTAAIKASLEAALAQALRLRPDVVHMHGLDFHEHLPPPGPPVLASLHLPADWYPSWAFELARPDTWLAPVSHSQAALCPPSPALLDPVPNGVPVDLLGLSRARRCGFTLMLARVCPEKGLHLALQAAHAADVPLWIGGELFPYPWHQEYFEREVRPLLDHDRRWLGPLGFARKRRLLRAARCLLIPSLVDETSSLVAMEAASCGTPVIAFRRGALPETVEDGRTGILVDDEMQMAAAIRDIGSIDPATCRAVARARFGRDRMAAQYLALYRQLAERRLAA